MYEDEINQKLKSVKNYLGSFAINEVENLKINSYPSFMVVNLDERGNTGTHWISLAMYHNDIFVCDSLGTLLPTNIFPAKLINFLYRISYHKTLHITRRLQELSSINCGKFCIYFIKNMSVHNNFENFLSAFSTDFKLIDLFIDIT